MNIEDLTASKMNVLHRLAMQSEALVILLQETHCTAAEKLVLSNYQPAGSSLSRRHGLATFVHERLGYMLLDQSPPTLEIEWLCVDQGCELKLELELELKELGNFGRTRTFLNSNLNSNSKKVCGV